MRSNEELLQRMANKDSAAWDTFLGAYGNLIYSHISYILKRYEAGRSLEEVEDAVQDFFLGFLEEGGRRLLLYEDRGDASLASWLRVVATNHVYGILRRRGRFVSIDELSETGCHRILQDVKKDSFESPRNHTALKEQVERLKAATSDLSDREQLVFNYYYLDERPRKDIAAVLGLAPNHVDQILYRIRRRLAERLK